MILGVRLISFKIINLSEKFSDTVQPINMGNFGKSPVVHCLEVVSILKVQCSNNVCIIDIIIFL